HHATPYRDYVIDAFNANMRFDQFTREQLAGDLLPNPTVDQKIATCYNRLLQTSHEGGVQPKEYLAIYAADRVRNLSAVGVGGAAERATPRGPPGTGPAPPPRARRPSPTGRRRGPPAAGGPTPSPRSGRRSPPSTPAANESGSRNWMPALRRSRSSRQPTRRR